MINNAMFSHFSQVGTAGMQAFLFDFDGTLMDSAPDLVRALDSALARAGLPGVGLELGTKMVGQGAGKLVEHALCHVTQDITMTMEDPFAACFCRSSWRNMKSYARKRQNYIRARPRSLDVERSGKAGRIGH